MSVQQQLARAGFARACITPPLGSRMHGFHSRDIDHGCEGVHDDLRANALWLEHGGEQVLIMGFDLLFFGRAESDRLRGALGRALDIAPRRIMLNTSHTHGGPATHPWASGLYLPPDVAYMNELTHAVLKIAIEAKNRAVDVTIWAGETVTDAPMNRRMPDGKGGLRFAPNPDGAVYDRLPFCLLKDTDGKPVCLMFSVACHPSSVGGWLISADYPGPAMDRLDAYLGAPCSMFLQGVGGDAKLREIVKDGAFSGTWEDVDRAGRSIADQVIAALDAGLTQIEPDIQAWEMEMQCDAAPIPERAWFEQQASEATQPVQLRRAGAQYILYRLDRGEKLPTQIPVTLHGIRLGEGVRLVGLEGEAVADLGHVIHDFYGSGITFPLGYTDGCQLYLPSDDVLAAGGYEAESNDEYGWPAPFAHGLEHEIVPGLERLKDAGVR